MKKVLALIAHDSENGDIFQLIKTRKEELAEHPEVLSGQHPAGAIL
jgi:methylglyoxal synthase